MTSPLQLIILWLCACSLLMSGSQTMKNWVCAKKHAHVNRYNVIQTCTEQWNPFYKAVQIDQLWEWFCFPGLTILWKDKDYTYDCTLHWGSVQKSSCLWRPGAFCLEAMTINPWFLAHPENVQNWWLEVHLTSKYFFALKSIFAPVGNTLRLFVTF